MRTHLYVDAFNLYYGCLKGTSYRWLNLAELSRRLLPPECLIERIEYFTARVSARPDPGQPIRQQVYLRALQTLPNLSIIYGHFMTHHAVMARVVPPGAAQTYVKVLRTDEKGSDVNLATELLADAYAVPTFELAVLITGDSDQLAPVLHVKNVLRRRVGVLNPQSRPSVVLSKAATFYMQIRSGVLRESQFPDQLTDRFGTFRRPTEWT